jgi:hypothetical protein
METAIGAMGPVVLAAAAGAGGVAVLEARALPATADAGGDAVESATAESVLVVFDARRALTEPGLVVEARIFAEGFVSAFVVCADDAGPVDAPESASSALATPAPLANATPKPNVIAPAPSQRYGMAFRGARRLPDIESPNPDPTDSRPFAVALKSLQELIS